MRRALIETLAWIGGVALIFAGGYLFGREAVVRDHMAARVAAVEQRDAYRDSLRMSRVAMRVDSVNVERVVTRWRVLRDSVRVPGDTVHDTVRVNVPVLIAAADSAITACTDALNTCHANALLAMRASHADSVAFERLASQFAVSEQQRKARGRGLWWSYLGGVGSSILVYSLTRR